MNNNIKKMLYLVVALVMLVFILHMTLGATSKKALNSKGATQESAKEDVAIKSVQLTAEQLKGYKTELDKYTSDIDKYKVQLSDNIQKLSNKKWLNRSFDDVVGITDADYKILQANNSIVYYMQSAYLTSASIKATVLNDKDGALEDLNEFKKIVKNNKYIVQNEELIRTIETFQKKWGL